MVRDVQLPVDFSHRYIVGPIRNNRKPWSKFINADNQHLVVPEVCVVDGFENVVVQHVIDYLLLSSHILFAYHCVVIIVCQVLFILMHSPSFNILRLWISWISFYATTTKTG